MEPNQDKKHKRIGWITSISTQVILLVLFYFLIAWKEPFPPIPSYGIELSFGLENQGRGEQPVTNPEPAEEITETTEEAQEIIDESTDYEPEEPLEESLPAESETPLTETSSPDVVSPEETAKEVRSKEEKEQPESAKKKEEPVLNPDATMSPTEKGTEKTDSKGTTDEKGNEGKEEGTIDGRALMGQQGAADGANLNMAGWTWDEPPKPKDDSSESGKIVYEVTIDDDGYIKVIDLKFSNISPPIERIYRQSVGRLTFSQTTNTLAPPTSSGTITFIIRSR